jgi:phosphatidylserine/phosphatidylglycerophosphate/cardiolipin synthase-like enzyme
VRRRVKNGGVTVQAIAGTRAVFFGLDLDAPARPGCLGFAVHRNDHTDHEDRPLAGFKTFRSVVPNPDPAKFYSSVDHPVQSFYWGDYTAKPGHEYTYRFVPRYGTPGALQDHPGVEAGVAVSAADPMQRTHGIFFNRGVAASQAYAERFGAPPHQLPPEKQAEAMAWLSRGLAEAIRAFIGQASSPRFALRAAVYEFTEPSVLAAFRQAHEAGADVRIVYHARDDHEGTKNRAAVLDAALDPAILIERTNAKIAHNKFIVLCEVDAGGAGGMTPISVWTGSTNFSEGGIFGHSNVGHWVRDPAVAGRYLDYWTELDGNPETPDLRDWVSANSAFDPDAMSGEGIHTLFSPRHGLAPLNWYASRFGGAGVLANITEAFGMGQAFEDALVAATGDALHFVMLDQQDSHQATWSQSPTTFVAVGSAGGPEELSRWAEEHLTGFNPRVPYLHTKILLVDALDADPTVISGSANFSPDSTSTNDENMLVVRGDTDLADVYFSEYARIFQHFYARWWASQLSKETADAHAHSFLAETDAWQTPYFTAGNPKQLARTVYSSKVRGNPSG